MQTTAKAAHGKLAVIGGGSYGTALAITLAPNYETVSLWVFEQELAADIGAARQNTKYLPGFALPENIVATSSLPEALEGAAMVLGVTPSMHVRRTFTAALPYLPVDAPVVSATKGIEAGTHLRMSEVIETVVSARFTPRVAVLSGPSFAKELAKGEPTLIVASSLDIPLAQRVQDEFSTPRFRVYINHDPIGTEVGAALKNVLAIAAGVCAGLGLGSNAMAALLTRGLAEITRLAVSLGGEARTLSGLSGLGDLILTCTGELSRNRTVGVELAKGRRIEEILSSMHMVAEGVENTFVAVELARRQGIAMPIAETMYAILREGKDPKAALSDLMERSPKTELV